MLKTNRREAPGTQAGRLLGELELKFDLMRLEGLEAGLEQEESRLEEEERSLKAELSEGRVRGAGAPARKVLVWCEVWLLRARRGMVLDRRRQLSLLREEVRFALRARGLR